jgi:hypothetical protein
MTAIVTGRETREINHLAGIGGFLKFQKKPVRRRDPISPGDTGDPAGFDPNAGEILDVGLWELLHRYRNVELPLSGGKGSIQRRRVADDYNFLALVSLDLKKAEPFIDHDSHLEGDPSSETPYGIALRFQCGDPEFHRSREGLFYFSPAVLLDEVKIIDSSVGDDVLRFIVRGSGSAPLERFNGTRLPVGTGAFGDVF